MDGCFFFDTHPQRPVSSSLEVSVASLDVQMSGKIEQCVLPFSLMFLENLSDCFSMKCRTTAVVVFVRTCRVVSATGVLVQVCVARCIVARCFLLLYRRFLAFAERIVAEKLPFLQTRRACIFRVTRVLWRSRTISAVDAFFDAMLRFSVFFSTIHASRASFLLHLFRSSGTSSQSMLDQLKLKKGSDHKGIPRLVVDNNGTNKRAQLTFFCNETRCRFASEEIHLPHTYHF